MLSEALVLHSCPRAPSTCSHSGLTLGAPQGPPVRRRSVAIHSGHGSSGSPVLSPSRWGGGGEAGEAGSHPCNFPKENHPSLLCPMPPCVPADVSGRCPQLSQRWLSLRRPRSKPSPVSTNRTLRQADNSASLFPPLRPSRGSRVHHAVLPSVPCALLGRRLSLCHVPKPRPPARAPLLFMMSEIGS